MSSRRASQSFRTLPLFGRRSYRYGGLALGGVALFLFDDPIFRNQEEVLVVGAGVQGLCATQSLLKTHRARVTLIDQGTVGSGTSQPGHRLIGLSRCRNLDEFLVHETALDAWENLQTEHLDLRFLKSSAQLVSGPYNLPLISTMASLAAKFPDRFRRLSREEMQSGPYRIFNLPSTFHSYVDERGGAVSAGPALVALLRDIQRSTDATVIPSVEFVGFTTKEEPAWVSARRIVASRLASLVPWSIRADATDAPVVCRFRVRLTSDSPAAAVPARGSGPFVRIISGAAVGSRYDAVDGPAARSRWLLPAQWPHNSEAPKRPPHADLEARPDIAVAGFGVYEPPRFVHVDVPLAADGFLARIATSAARALQGTAGGGAYDVRGTVSGAVARALGHTPSPLIAAVATRRPSGDGAAGYVTVDVVYDRVVIASGADSPQAPSTAPLAAAGAAGKEDAGLSYPLAAFHRRVLPTAVVGCVEAATVAYAPVVPTEAAKYPRVPGVGGAIPPFVVAVEAGGRGGGVWDSVVRLFGTVLPFLRTQSTPAKDAVPAVSYLYGCVEGLPLTSVPLTDQTAVVASSDAGATGADVVPPAGVLRVGVLGEGFDAPRAASLATLPEAPALRDAIGRVVAQVLPPGLVAMTPQAAARHGLPSPYDVYCTWSYAGALTPVGRAMALRAAGRMPMTGSGRVSAVAAAEEQEAAAAHTGDAVGYEAWAVHRWPIVDEHDAAPSRVLYAGLHAGQGFKIAPAVGRLAAQWATDALVHDATSPRILKGLSWSTRTHDAGVRFGEPSGDVTSPREAALRAMKSVYGIDNYVKAMRCADCVL